MIKVTSNKKQKTEWFDDSQTIIIVEALINEMERCNTALKLISDEHARSAIVEAKGRIFEVFRKMNEFISDPDDE